jgi:hypothetical protein
MCHPNPPTPLRARTHTHTRTPYAHAHTHTHTAQIHADAPPTRTHVHVLPQCEGEATRELLKELHYQGCLKFLQRGQRATCTIDEGGGWNRICSPAPTEKKRGNPQKFF